MGWLSAGRRHGVLPPALSPPPGVACRIFWAPPSPSTYPPPPHCRPVGPLLLLTPLVLLETRPPPRSPPPTRPTTLGNGVAFHTSALDACCCIGGSRCTHLWRVPARPGPPPWAQAPLVRVFFFVARCSALGSERERVSRRGGSAAAAWRWWCPCVPSRVRTRRGGGGCSGRGGLLLWLCWGSASSLSRGGGQRRGGRQQLWRRYLLLAVGDGATTLRRIGLGAARAGPRFPRRTQRLTR